MGLVTTEALLTRAKLYSFFPESTGGPPLTDAEILQLADDELQDYVFPRVLAAGGEWRVRSYQQPLVASVSSYRVPARAHLSRLRDLLVVRSDGATISIPWIDPEALGTMYTSAQSSVMPARFYFQDGNVTLWPATTTSPSCDLLMKYYLRPGRLVPSSDCARITSISQTTISTVLVWLIGFSGGSPPFFTSSGTYSVDFYKATGSFENVAIDVDAAWSATPFVTLPVAGNDLTALAVGDYVSAADTCNIPQIPDGMHAWLARRVAVAILEQVDPAAVDRAQAKADEIEGQIVSAIQPRMDGEPMPFVDPFSPLNEMRS